MTDPDRRRLILACAAGAALGTGPARASAEYPRRAVRIVVPYSVGVGPDVVARSVAERLALRWGQPVIVDNKPGGSGIVAFGEVRQAVPDGHTLFLADTATLVVNPLLHATLPYDPARDLVPLTLLFRATFVIWVGGGHRFRSITDLLDAARRAPDTVSYGSLGNGHASQVAIESFARAAGVRLLHVPFKDAGMLLAAVAAGTVDFTAFSVNTVGALMTANRMKPLAVAARQRLAALPGVPTLVEAGGPPVEMHPWAALVAVSGTPVPVIDQLLADLSATLATAEVRGCAERAGFEITPSTPQALQERIEADQAQVRPLVAEGRLARM